MLTEDSKITRNIRLKKDYFQVDFHSPGISALVKPGQFVNVQVPGLNESIFRRPFSIFKAENSILSIIYKVVGKGTDKLSKSPENTVCSLLGPLGNSYTIPEKNDLPVLVVGGYGSAATYILAKKSPIPGIAMIGAKTKEDILLAEEYENLGFEVITATEDGSSGYKGFITGLLEKYLASPNAFIYACGPNPMMYAMAGMLRGKKIRAELSLDHPMCCGVGACFACVVKVKDGNSGWRFARSCKEGPVFRHEELYLEN